MNLAPNIAQLNHPAIELYCRVVSILNLPTWA